MTYTSLGYSLEPPDNEHWPECEDQDTPGAECICDDLSDPCDGCGRVGSCGCP